MARIILHSDDFGLHQAVNAAIVTCAQAGVLSSASVLANGPAADEAFALARAQRGLGIGVHLNIVRGRPLSPPGEIPSLVDTRGRFLGSMLALLARAQLGLLRVEDICREYHAQITRVVAAGIEPTHLDGEKHSHILLPQAAEALKRVGRQMGITRVRKLNERALLTSLRSDKGIPAIQRAKLWLLEQRMRSARRHWVDFAATDHTLGLATVGCVDGRACREMLAALLALPAPTTVEWFFHVGHAFDYDALRAEWGSVALTSARPQETAFLLSAEIRALLAQHPASVITYRELPA